jgi:uncharacterized protein (DUF4415 family)
MSRENIVSTTLEEARERIRKDGSRTDWARVDAMTDAEIEANMRDDPDWAEFMDIDWSKATIVYPVEKQAVSIRLDRDVLDFFKASGKGYQTRINAVLRSYMDEISKRKESAE